MSEPAKRRPGRPRLVDRKASEGQPEIRARVSPDLAEWVRAAGGADYVRRLLEREREMDELQRLFADPSKEVRRTK